MTADLRNLRLHQSVRLLTCRRRPSLRLLFEGNRLIVVNQKSVCLMFVLKFGLFSNVAEMINSSNLKRYCSKMPSLQTALPPELANNAIRLYRECLRRAKYVGHKQHNTELVVQMVRQQFKKHMHETDPDKIQKLKDDAARGLINHILYEAEEMTGRKFS
ncbi:hypothetical protein L1887_28340 [Cichorium endivia]|nr:hypothetical protein L1887_28340 [Cichorium endivia]